MKNLILLIILIFSINLYAQNDIENINVFLRIYDFQGQKIAKGKLLSISEKSLQLKKKGKSIEIPLSNIGTIKTKRSAGNNVLIGGASGAAAFGIIAAASAEADGEYLFTTGEGAGYGALVGGVAGAAIGGITILFKKSSSYEISGDELKLKLFKESITGL